MRLSLVPLIVLAVAAGACSNKRSTASGAGEAVPVTAAVVERRPLPVEADAIGHVEPYTTVAVKTQVAGELTAVAFREGQDVAKGDLLFTLDRRPYEAALGQAKANLERDRARAKNAEAEVVRYGDLVQKDFVTREQYDSVQADAAALKATVQADEAALQRTEVDLSYCTIVSPISGRTGSLLVHAGNVVKANDDKPLVVINQIQPIYVTFSLPESNLSEIKKRSHNGPLAVLASPPGADAHRGELTFMDNAVDAATGTIGLKATFANTARALWPGQFVDVVLILSEEADAVVVPSPAIQTGQSGSYVFVIKPDSTVESRAVVVARTRKNMSVVEKGLSPGEKVVTDGQLRLAPGSRVEIKNGEARS
jgi:multidrug efflux system membrane fusion protein